MLRIAAESMEWFKRFKPAPKRYRDIVARYGVRELEIVWDEHTKKYVLVYNTPAMIESSIGGLCGGLWKEATVPQPVWVIEDENNGYLEPGEWLLEKIAQFDALREGRDTLKAKLHEQDRRTEEAQQRESKNTIESVVKEIAPTVRREMSDALGTVSRKQGKGPNWGGNVHYPEDGPVGTGAFRGRVGTWDAAGHRVERAP